MRAVEASQGTLTKIFPILWEVEEEKGTEGQVSMLAQSRPSIASLDRILGYFPHGSEKREEGM